MKILVLLVLVGAGVFLVLKFRSSSPGKGRKVTATKRKPAAGSKAQPIQRSPYRATVIVCRDDACDAAKALLNQPFLGNDKSTPLLPLPGCDAVKCKCRYEHRDDRRETDNERRLEGSLRADLYSQGGNDDRRAQKRGRRADDNG